MTSWVVALHTVLDTADPVTLCWAAVIRSVMLCPDIFCSLDAATNWDFTASSLLLYRYETKKNPGNNTSTSAATVRNPPLSPHLGGESRMCKSSSSGGRNKDNLTQTARKCWTVSVLSRRQTWLRSRGCCDCGVRSLTHPTRVSVSLSSRCGTPDPCLLLPPPPPAAAAALKLCERRTEEGKWRAWCALCATGGPECPRSDVQPRQCRMAWMKGRSPNRSRRGHKTKLQQACRSNELPYYEGLIVPLLYVAYYIITLY